MAAIFINHAIILNSSRYKLKRGWKAFLRRFTASPRYITLVEPRAYLQKSHQFIQIHFVEIGSIFAKGCTVRMVRTIG